MGWIQIDCADPERLAAGYLWRVMAGPEGNEFCLIYSLD